MSTDVETERRVEAGTRMGKLIAIGYSAELINGVGKEVHESAEICKWGIPGDRHYGETRISRGHVVPNKRPITVVGVEATRAACEKLGIAPIPPGGLGENLLVEGLGDLSEVGPGDEIRVLSPEGEERVVLEVQKQNDPCASLQVYHKMIVKELFGKRGLLCTVLKTGHISMGDSVTITRKA